MTEYFYTVEFDLISETAKEEIFMPKIELNHSTQSEGDDGDGLKVALASISPLLGRISETCKDQSKVYLTGLFSDQPWAKKSKH